MRKKIEDMYLKSTKLKNGEKIKYLNQLIKMCKKERYLDYEYHINFDLMDELVKRGDAITALHLYRENIDVYLRSNVSSDKLVEWFPWAAYHVEVDLTCPQEIINDFFSKSKQMFEKSGHCLRSYYQEYYKYLIRIGEWDEAFRQYSKWMLEKRDFAAQSVYKEEADRALYFFTVGDYKNGEWIFDTVRKGIEVSNGVRVYAYARTARYYHEMGKKNQLEHLLRWGYRYSKNKIDRLEETAEFLKIIAIEQPKLALKLWEKHKYHFERTNNDRARFSFGIATYLLSKKLGHLLVGSPTEKRMDRIIEDMFDILEWMDERNQTDAYGMELLYWKEALLKTNVITMD